MVEQNRIVICKKYFFIFEKNESYANINMNELKTIIE